MAENYNIQLTFFGKVLGVCDGYDCADSLILQAYNCRLDDTGKKIFKNVPDGVTISFDFESGKAEYYVDKEESEFTEEEKETAAITKDEYKPQKAVEIQFSFADFD